MLFKLTNKNSDRMTHCGVLEFVADEGICYLPHWVCLFNLTQSGLKFSKHTVCILYDPLKNSKLKYVYLNIWVLKNCGYSFKTFEEFKD